MPHVTSPAHAVLVIVLTILIYALLRRGYFRVCRLPEAAYRSASITVAAWRTPKFIIFGVATIAPVVVWASKLSWDSFEDGWLLRLVIGVGAVLLAWTNATYETNAYFGREHLLDRGLTLVLAALVAIHPAFTPIFLLTMMPVWRQVTYPGIAEAITDKLLVVDLIIAFAAFLYVHLLLGGETWHYMTVAMGLVAMHYWYPGWAKVRLGPRPWSWALGNRTSDLAMNAWVYGHVGFLRRETVGRIVDVMRRFDVPIQALTLSVELASVFLLANRWLAIALLGMFVVMHVGIFISSGLAFWKWSVMDVALIVFLLGAGPHTLEHLFSPMALALSVMIVALGGWHSAPAWLGWIDSRLVQLFRYEVVDVRGRVYALPNNFCAPYDQAFCQGRFGFLTDRPALVATHGNIRPNASSDKQGERGISAYRMRMLIDRTNGDPRRVDRLCRRYGVNRFDAEQARRFDVFIGQYFGYLNRTGRKSTIFGWLPHPKHFFHWTRGDVYRMRAPAAVVRVRYLEVFTEPSNYRVIQDCVVREIEVGCVPKQLDTPVIRYDAATSEAAAA